MKFLLGYLVLGFFLFEIPCYAQSDEDQRESLDSYIEALKTEFDHLEPVNSYFEFPQYRLSYYERVKSLLFSDLGIKPVARMLVMPSFEPEFVISVDQENGLYYLSHVYSNASIWETKNSNKIDIKNDKRQISCELATEIGNVYALAIEQTRYASEGTVGVDGVNYFFSIYASYGLRSSTKWSPIEGSKIFELIELTRSLTTDIITPESEFLERANKLANRF